MFNYAIPLLTACLALMQLMKDWGAHTATWRRALILVLILCLGIGGTINAYLTSKRANEQASTIKALTTAVQTANASQVQNTKVFTESIEHFTAKLGTLEADVKTADLRDQVGHLRADLEKTQKALITPRAVLTAGIVDSTDRPDKYGEFTHVFVHYGKPVPFEIGYANDSGVSGQSGYFAIRICNDCRFHSEPEGFLHPHGQPAYERTLSFDRVVSGGHSPTIPIEVDLPDGLQQFTIAHRTSCQNCEDSGWKTATVAVSRYGPKPVPVKP